MIESVPPDQTTAAEPAAERITAALVQTIAGVVQAAGYWLNAKVYRPTPGVAKPTANGCIEVTLDEEEIETDGVPTGIEQILATHMVICDVIVPEANALAIDTALNRLKADVKRAVYVNRTLSGIAIDTVCTGAVILDTDSNAYQGRCGLMFATRYRTVEDDPYQMITNPA